MKSGRRPRRRYPTLWMLTQRELHRFEHGNVEWDGYAEVRKRWPSIASCDSPDALNALARAIGVRLGVSSAVMVPLVTILVKKHLS